MLKSPRIVPFRVRSGVAVLALGAAAAAGAGCGRSQASAATPTEPVVAVVPVERQSLARTVSLTAELRPYQEVDVHAKVAGYVKDIPVDVGTRVVLGQRLATLEIPELEDDVRLADAAVAAAASEIERTKADVERAQSAYDAAHLIATRLAGVAKAQKGLIAQQDVDDAAGKDRVAAAQLATSKAAAATAQQQLKVATANQAKTRTLLGYSVITAQFAGVVTKRYADVGSMIQAGTSSQTQTMPVVRLSEDDRLRLVIPVPESAVPTIHVGRDVSVSVGVLGKTFKGSVARAASQIDPATRTMHTEVDVENPTRELVPGMFADVTLPLVERPNVLTVPILALDRSGDHTSVLRVGPDHVAQTQVVTVGLETADTAEILSGLAEGDLVVVGSRSQIPAGTRVTPKITAPAPAAAGAR